MLPCKEYDDILSNLRKIKAQSSIFNFSLENSTFFSNFDHIVGSQNDNKK